jgi:arylsulfatase A-like enzyme
LIPGGREIPLADFTDIFPTLCDLSGVDLPPGRAFDGRSLAEYLRGAQGARPPREWIFCQYHTRRVVRDARYKLYSTGELYDVSADPEETRDISSSSDASVVAACARLKKALATLPPDSPPPFELRSQSAFKLRQAGELKSQP